MSDGYEYLGPLECPDLTSHFGRIHFRPDGQGRLIPSDWADKADDDPRFGIHRRCGFWAREEAALLYNLVYPVGGLWADIGCHTGWTTLHIHLGARAAIGVDPELANAEFFSRFCENLQAWGATGVTLATAQAPFGGPIRYFAGTSHEFFTRMPTLALAGVCIDGNHDDPEPLRDAERALRALRPLSAGPGLILFHDFVGRPIQRAVEFLIGEGLRCRVFNTAQIVACCWRGEYEPPDHEPDPRLRDLPSRCPDFNFRRCS